MEFLAFILPRGFALPVLLLGSALTLLGIFMLYQLVRDQRRQTRSIQAGRTGELDALKEKITEIRNARQTPTERLDTWKGFANFEIFRKIHHGKSGICSFYIRPLDRRLKLAPFVPGQHIVLRLQMPDSARTITRRYSLSDAPNDSWYRISVKLQPAPNGRIVPDGLGSSYLHHLTEDSRNTPEKAHLLVSAPRGDFHLNQDDDTPIVLIAGGVGVTPLLSMFNAILIDNPKREVWFFYVVRNSTEDILFDLDVLTPEASELLEQHPNLHLFIYYSQPTDRDVVIMKSNPKLYHEGRVTVAELKRHLPSSNYHYYNCGPDSMMADVERDLLVWGVPEAHIHSERFGPPGKATNGLAVPETRVRFARSQQEVVFGPEDRTLLDAAERAGISIASDCRAGTCGSCQISVVEGKVRSAWKTSYPVESGKCLTCSSLPDGEVVLDC